MENKEKFLQLLRSVKRNGIDELCERISGSDFFIAPASTKYHDSFEGGLVKHSIEVYEILTKIYPYDCDEDTLKLVALLHDLCKIAYYTIGTRNVKNKDGKWETVPYYTVDDKFPFGHGEKSVYLINECINLTPEEAMAIRWHMGAYVGSQDWNNLSGAFEKFPLAMYLHFADMISTYDDKFPK